MREYTAAVIGRNGKYGHGLELVFNEFPQIPVVAVADTDPDQAAACASRNGAERQFTDYSAMLGATRPKIVAIGVPTPEEHLEMVLACIDTGVLAIYTEKPFARTLAEADAILTACNAADVHIAVAHQLHTLPLLRHVRQLVDNGLIGNMKRIRGQGKNDQRGGAEDLLVLGTHILGQIRALAGDPLWAAGHIRHDGEELRPEHIVESAEGLGLIGGNDLSGCYAFADGVCGMYDSYAGPGRSHMELLLDGDTGQILVQLGGVRQAFHYDAQAPQFNAEGMVWKRLSIPGEAATPPGQRGDRPGGWIYEGNRLIVESLLHCIEDDATPISSGEEARWAMEMCFAVPESQRSGCRVSFPLKNRENPWNMM